MKTKLILGLTAGVLTAATAGHAQNAALNPIDAPATFASILATPSPDPLSAGVVSTPDAAVDVSAFVDPSDANPASDMSLGVAFDFLNTTQSPSLTAVDAASAPAAVISSDTTANRPNSEAAAFGNWLNYGTPDVPASLTATTPVSFGSQDSAPSQYAVNPAMDNNADALMRGEDRAGSGSHEGGGRMPLLSSPEPGTISLFFMGGAAASGALRRRK